MTYTVESYPLPPARAAFVKVALGTFALSVLSLVAGSLIDAKFSIATILGISSGYVYGFSMLLFVLSNMYSQTGAFEVFVNNRKIFSRLESGTMPSKQKLLELVEKQLEHK